MNATVFELLFERPKLSVLRIRKSGDNDKVGLVLRRKDEYVLVQGVQKDGIIPKLESQPGAPGLRDGDVIVRVNGQEKNGAAMLKEFVSAEDIEFTFVQSDRLVEKFAGRSESSQKELRLSERSSWT